MNHVLINNLVKLDNPDKRFPKVQILTIEELLNGKQLEYPRVAPEVTFKRAERRKQETQKTQGKINF